MTMTMTHDGQSMIAYALYQNEPISMNTAGVIQIHFGLNRFQVNPGIKYSLWYVIVE